MYTATKKSCISGNLREIDAIKILFNIQGFYEFIFLILLLGTTRNSSKKYRKLDKVKCAITI